MSIREQLLFAWVGVAILTASVALSDPHVMAASMKRAGLPSALTHHILFCHNR
jgi:hypothetical protein